MDFGVFALERDWRGWIWGCLLWSVTGEDDFGGVYSEAGPGENGFGCIFTGAGQVWGHLLWRGLRGQIFGCLLWSMTRGGQLLLSSSPPSQAGGLGVSAAIALRSAAAGDAEAVGGERAGGGPPACSWQGAGFIASIYNLCPPLCCDWLSSGRMTAWHSAGNEILPLSYGRS